MSGCVVQGCDRLPDVLGKTICRTHYARLRAGKDLYAPVRVVRPSRGVCIVDGCPEIDKGPRGYCAKHLGRFLHNGDPLIVKHQRDRGGKKQDHPRWTGADATYDAIHQRLRSDRGPAKTHACVDCGGRAFQWSYDHTDAEQKIDERGIPYSTDTDRYVARCVPCHKRFDLARFR